MASINNINRVDLHTHSNESDGLYSPEEVVKLSAREGLAAVALTDHDTINGLEEAIAAGARYGIEIVPGVELSCYYRDREIHILGYYPAKITKLKQALESRRRERLERMEKMVAKLNSLAIPLTMNDILIEAKPAAPGRLHLARLLLKRKFVNSLEEAFSVYLLRGRAAYVPRKDYPAFRAIKMLQKCEALPVIAHPGERGMELLPHLVRLGLKGVEVYHPDHSPEQTRDFRDISGKMGLIITGGSDFHGDGGSLNRRPGSVSAPYDCLETLKEHVKGR